MSGTSCDSQSTATLLWKSFIPALENRSILPECRRTILSGKPHSPILKWKENNQSGIVFQNNCLVFSCINTHIIQSQYPTNERREIKDEPPTVEQQKPQCQSLVWALSGRIITLGSDLASRNFFRVPGRSCMRLLRNHRSTCLAVRALFFDSPATSAWRRVSTSLLLHGICTGWTEFINAFGGHDGLRLKTVKYPRKGLDELSNDAAMIWVGMWGCLWHSGRNKGRKVEQRAGLVVY